MITNADVPELSSDDAGSVYPFADATFLVAVAVSLPNCPSSLVPGLGRRASAGFPYAAPGP